MLKTYHVSQNHPLANDANPGTGQLPFKTISRAAELLEAGDCVIVHNGIYRERIAPANGGYDGAPVTYMAAEGEKVIVRGSEILDVDWMPYENLKDVYIAEIPHALVSGFNPFAVKALNIPGNFCLGQLFIDSHCMLETDDMEQLELNDGSWMSFHNGTHILLHYTDLNEKKHLAEISVRNRLFAPHKRKLGYITVRGFTFEHCANQYPYFFWDKDGYPQAGAVSFRSGHHFIFENNTIQYVKSIGLDCGCEGAYDLEGLDDERPEIAQAGYHQIVSNRICDIGVCGIAGWVHTQTRIAKNVISRCNCHGWTGCEEAGIKVHLFFDGIIEDNYVINNDANGIWLDNQWEGSRVTRNVCLQNFGAGIFVELGEGPCLVDHNILAFTRQGDGLYTHDASGVTAAHNLFAFNSHFGVYMRTVTERDFTMENGKFLLAATCRQTIINNLFIDNYRGQVCLPLDSDRSYDNVCDYNLYMGGTQWQWEGQIPDQFVIGTNDGRISQEALKEVLSNGFSDNNILPENIPDQAFWLKAPVLDLASWQTVMHYDTHSSLFTMGKAMIENGGDMKRFVNFPKSGMYLQFMDGSFIDTVSCRPVDGITDDFYGIPFSPDHIHPGPFQHYKGNELNRFFLNKGWTIIW